MTCTLLLRSKDIVGNLKTTLCPFARIKEGRPRNLSHTDARGIHIKYWIFNIPCIAAGRLFISQKYKNPEKEYVGLDGTNGWFDYLEDAPNEDIEQIRKILLKEGLSPVGKWVWSEGGRRGYN